MKLVVALLACVASAMSSGSAGAQEPEPPPVAPAPPTVTPPPAPAPALAAAPARPSSRVYLGGRIGMYRPSDDNEAFQPFSFETGLDLEGLVGVQLNPYLSVEGGIGYYASSTNTLTANDGTTGPASIDFRLSVLPITASVRVGAEVDRVTFYGLAGVGLHMTQLEVNLSSAAASGSISEDDDVFGWHLGAGLAVALNPRLSLGAEVRRTFVTGQYTTLLGPDALGAPTTELTLDGLRLGATVTFRL